jgi:phage shock protein A
MAIFSRLTDLLKANINDLIDRAEDPEKMVKQIIIDMEEKLQNAVQGLGSVMASERQILLQLEKAQAESKLWEDRAKIALKASDEKLAKKAVDSKLQCL